MEHLLDDERKTLLKDVGLLILRVWAGLVMAIAHGLPKLTDFAERAEGWDGMFFGMPGAMATGLAIFGEFVCALLVAAGALTRLAAIPVVVAMAVALYAHFGLWGDEFRDGELAMMFLSIFLLFVFTGPGRFSIDGLIENSRS